MRHGLAERVVAEGHQVLRFTLRGFQVGGIARAQDPDVPGRRQVEHAKGPLLLFIARPHRHHSKCRTRCRIDPLRPGQGFLVRFRVEEWSRPNTPPLLEAFMECRNQV